MYKKSLFLLRYEDLAANPKDVAGTIYKDYLDLPLPAKVRTWLETSTTRSDEESITKRRYATQRNSTAAALRWRTSLSAQLQGTIAKACATIIKSLGYDK